MEQMDPAFLDIALLLIIAAVVGAVAVRLRQPLIVAFIAVGIIAGPDVLAIADDQAFLEVMASVGIALLLFVVGLKLDLHLIRAMGPVALATGLGQVAFTAGIGYAIAIGLGMAPLIALYVAVALTFSSTIIIVKLLSDKKEIDALHGRIAIGLLIVQDIVVLVAMIALTALGAGTGAETVGLEMVVVALYGLGFVAVLGLLIRYILPALLHRLAASPELLVLFAIAWAVGLGAAAEGLGFSMEVGAFLAGVALASTHYREAIANRLVTVRDFLLLFFFIVLGAQIDLSLVGAQLSAAVVFSLFVLIGNPLIVMIIMGVMGYRSRTGFLTGLTVAQISEFSLILAALGLNLGHIDEETLGLITLVGLITITLSTYMILYSHPLYDRLAPVLGLFERRVASHTPDHEPPTDLAPDFIVLGLGRYGSRIAEGLAARGQRVLAVDFDPVLVASYAGRGMAVCYGDATDPELPATLPLRHTRWLISSVPDDEASLALVKAARAAGYTGGIAVSTHDSRWRGTLERAGADAVLLPYADAAGSAVARFVEDAGNDGDTGPGRDAHRPAT